MNIKKILWISGLVLLVLLLIILVLLNNTKKNKITNNKKQVVTSFYPLYFFTNEIAKDKINISNITPSGSEPHEYEPTPIDMTNIENSDLVILNGGGLESWGENIKINLNKSKTKIVSVGDNLFVKKNDKNHEESEGGENHHHGGLDPHIWLSPILAIQIVDKIESELSQIDTENQEYYKSNAHILKEKLSKLDGEFKDGLKTCVNKNIITSHAAFYYLASTYGLNQISIAGLSQEEEPSSKEMTEIVKFAKSNNVKYIFFESLISPKLSLTIAREIGAKTLLLNPIEGLTIEEIKSGKDYFSEMNNNLINLKIALECK